jgi:hypothetical protein
MINLSACPNESRTFSAWRQVKSSRSSVDQTRISQPDQEKSHRHHDEGKAGNEHDDRGECCNVSNDIGHLCSPYSLCFSFVLFLFESQQKFREIYRDIFENPE